MKKISSLFMALVILITATFAQAKQEPKKATKPVQKMQPAMAAKDSAHLKKDGSADKRYKENKGTKTTATTPLKKDGTPDKRYKENKKTKS